MDETKKQKQLVLLFHDFSKEHLGKDVFLVPYYIGKKLGYQVKICFPKRKYNEELPKSYRNVSLESFYCPNTKGVKYYYPFFAMLWMLRHYKEIDFLMLFHFFFRTIFITEFFRMLNKRAFLYVKLDIPDFVVSKIDNRISHNCVLAYLYKNFSEKVNLFSCETNEVFEDIKHSNLFPFINDKISLMPNGFDDDYIKEIGMEILPYEKKKNLMLTVGRLGTQQKNTEMFLKAIERLPVSDWKYIFIGNIEKSFAKYISDFFDKNPNLKERVSFVGNIQDKKQLWDYYNKAKVFVLTSTWESYGLVLNEAARFGDYIVTTKVGAAQDILSETNFGTFVRKDDDKQLSEILFNIQKNLMVERKCTLVDLSWASYINKLLDDAKYCDFFNSMC